MKETQKMMKSIITGKEKETNEKELIKKYQEQLCPNILAYFYCNNFTLIYKTSKSFDLLHEEDKASFCLQELDNCLRNYNLNSKNKFTTYFIRCYKNRLITENKKINKNDNKANLTCNILIENTIIKDEINITDYDLLLNEYKLNKEECNLCKLLLKGFSKKEIAIIYKTSSSRLSQKILKIKQKILNYT